MAGLVVDASVSAAWFLSSEATRFTQAALSAATIDDVLVPVEGAAAPALSGRPSRC
jgi:hypothetical protein